MLLCDLPCAGHRKRKLGHLDWVQRGVGMVSQHGMDLFISVLLYLWFYYYMYSCIK